MDSLLKSKKGFSLVELLVVIAVLIIILGTAALTVGTSMRDSGVKKAAFTFKTMMIDGLKEAMTNYKLVIVERDTSFGGGTRMMMYIDGDENHSFGGTNDTMLAYFVVTGDSVDPGRPAGFTGDYYFVPNVNITASTESGGTTLDLTSLYGTGFNNVPILSGSYKILIKPEGVYEVLPSKTPGLVLFRNTRDIEEGEQDRQYMVLITKTFLRVLKLEDDGSGNYYPRELQ